MQTIPKTSRELENAIEYDKRRQAIDAAKKRAVAQKADYDTFRNMVLTAHLKPIQAPSAPPSGPNLPAWGLDASGAWMRDAAAAGEHRHQHQHQQQQQQRQQCTPSPRTPSEPADAAAAGAAAAAVPAADGGTPIPSTGAEFERMWARAPGPPSLARWRYLRTVGAPRLLPRLFRVELPAALLGGVAAALEAGARAAEGAEEAAAAAEFARQTMAALKECGRFDLVMRLQPRAARDVLARLLRLLDGSDDRPVADGSGGDGDRRC